MNEKKAVCKHLRQEFGKLGWALLIYFVIMNVAVVLVVFLDVLMFSLSTASLPNVSLTYLQQELARRLAENGWGYVLATVIGAILLLIWKKPDFCLRQIWKTEKAMSFGDFFRLLVIFFIGQTIFQLLKPVLTFALAGLGIPWELFASNSTLSGDSLSLFLYIGLLAPVFEEILFRGLVLRTLQPYGKKFAILASALLFAIYHGNLMQTICAVPVGLVLGYVAVEYSVGWSMVLHMVNNLLLGDTLGRLTQFLPLWIEDIIFFVVIWGSTVAAVITLIVKRKEVKAYLCSGKMHPWCLKSFFTSPGILVYTAVMIGNLILSILLKI